MDDVVNRLGDVVHAFYGRLRESSIMHEVGLPSFQARIIRFFAQNPGASAQRLVLGTGRDKAQVARAIKELEMRGLLLREPDPADRRVSCLSLSPKGEDLFRRLRQQRDAVAEEMLRDLSDDERTILSGLLARMHAALGGIGPQL